MRAQCERHHTYTHIIFYERTFSHCSVREHTNNCAAREHTDCIARSKRKKNPASIQIYHCITRGNTNCIVKEHTNNCITRETVKGETIQNCVGKEHANTL